MSRNTFKSVLLAGASAVMLVAGPVQAHETKTASGAMTQSAKAVTMSEASGKAASLRVTLTQLLGEHVVLAAGATNAALGGRSDEFQSAAAALDSNSVDISKAIASVYGEGAGEAFLPLWRKHIGFFVDYTTGLAAKDMAKQEKAINDLIGYSEDFGAFINAASPSLSKDAVAKLVRAHAITLKGVVDAQAAGDTMKAYEGLREAYGHMANIAGALAEAIVQQFPERFA